MPTSETPALHLAGVSKTFSGMRALTSLDLTIQRGEVHALVGENGSGKSTAIKILSGFHEPDPGASITVGGVTLTSSSPTESYAAGARFVHQDLGLVAAESIVDNFFLGGGGFPTRYGTIRRRDVAAVTREALAEIGLGHLDTSTLISELSPAQRAGVAIARALRPDDSGEVRLIVLDEPTATLAADEVEELLDIVRASADRGIGVLYVTHRLDEVFAVATQVSVLRDGHRVFSGDIADVSRQELVHHLLGGTFEESQRRPAPAEQDGRQPILSVRNLSTRRLSDVSLDAYPGEVLGIAGITGSGRDSLCSALFGAIPIIAGAVTVEGETLRAFRPDHSIKRGLAFIPGDRKALGGFMNLDAAENLAITDPWRSWKGWRISGKAEAQHVSGWFAKLDVRPRGDVHKQMAQFSGGNQQKLLFAKWLQRRPKVMLVDDPTQGVDIAAKVSLHEQLSEAARAGAAVIVSSPDLDELVSVCQRVIVLREGRIVDELVGDQIDSKTMGRACLASEADSDRGV